MFYFDLARNFFFRTISPIGGFVLLLIIATPIGDLIPVKLSVETQLALLIYFTVTYGSRLLHATLGKGDKKIVSFSLQDTAMQNALSLIPSKGAKIDILIYTSFSLFSNYEKLQNKYPQLKNSQLRILLRDPDITSPLKPSEVTDTRKRQISTALDSLARYAKYSGNIEVRFYANEPWVRGIKIGQKHLFYSTYSNKRKSSPDHESDGYSGSDIPWICISNDVPNVLPGDLEPVNKFMDGYASLFDLIWTQCTTTKSLLIDLDGTLYANEKVATYLKRKMPVELYRHLVADNRADMGELEQFELIYSRMMEAGMSSTESILRALQESVNVSMELEEYLEWKDQTTESLTVNIEKNESLVNAIKKAESNYKILLLTNHTRKFAEKALEKIGCEKAFEQDSIITINDLGVTKPSHEILGILANRYNIDISRSIFIGDRQAVDLDYARDYCLGTVLVKDTKALPAFLNDCWLPFTWICGNARDYEGLELYLRNECSKLS